MGQAGQLAGSNQVSKALSPWLRGEAARLNLHLCPLLLARDSLLAVCEHNLHGRGAQGEVGSSFLACKEKLSRVGKRPVISA